MDLMNKIDFEGVQVITPDLIAKEHGMTKFNITKLILANIYRFIVGRDVYIFNKKSLYSWGEYRNLFTNNKQQTAYLFTERGYLKLVKIMNNDRAWDVYEKMMDIYFAAKEVKEVKDLSPLEILELWRQKTSEKVDQIDRDVKAIAAHTNYDPDYFTITAWVSTHKIKLGKDRDFRLLGKAATDISKKLGIETKEVPDPKYGRINSYHKSVLEDLFTVN